MPIEKRRLCTRKRSIRCGGLYWYYEELTFQTLGICSSFETREGAGNKAFNLKKKR
jgi:hypothetical protein